MQIKNMKNNYHVEGCACFLNDVIVHSLQNTAQKV